MEILLRMQESGQKRMKLSEKSLQYNYDTITILFVCFLYPYSYSVGKIYAKELKEYKNCKFF